MSINDTMYYYIKNLQGDITKIVNHQGKVMVEYTYDAWGNILKEKSNVTPSYATVKAFNPFRYRGYVYDTDTGLYYLQSRYYDPKTGRFINADDTNILMLSSFSVNNVDLKLINLFSYCYNNPVLLRDNNGYIAGIDDAIFILIGLTVTVCVLCGWMSTDQFRQTWQGFCRSVGNGLSSIWDDIWYGSKSIWDWSLSKIKKSIKAISKFITIVRADNKIRKKVKRKSKTRYWSANLKSGYVDIGKPLTFSQAKSYVRKGKNVFTVTKREAKLLSKSAYGGKKPVGPEIDKGKNNVIGYYWHYHVYGRKNKAHVWYLF